MNHRTAPTRRLLGLAGLTAAIVMPALTGCATSVERRAAAPYVGSQGASENVVLPSPVLAEENYFAASELHAEYARRDLALGVGSVGTGYPYDTWPDQGYPSLDRARRITVGTRPESITYFQPAASPRSWPWPAPSRSVP